MSITLDDLLGFGDTPAEDTVEPTEPDLGVFGATAFDAMLAHREAARQRLSELERVSTSVPSHDSLRSKSVFLTSDMTGLVGSFKQYIDKLDHIQSTAGDKQVVDLLEDAKAQGKACLAKLRKIQDTMCTVFGHYNTLDDNTRAQRREMHRYVIETNAKISRMETQNDI